MDRSVVRRDQRCDHRPGRKPTLRGIVDRQGVWQRVPALTSSGDVTAGYLATYKGYYYHTPLMQKITVSVEGERFPSTTRSVTVAATGRGLHKTIHYAHGYDNRNMTTPSGLGTIQLVTPVLTRWLQPAYRYETGGIGILRIRFVADDDAQTVAIDIKPGSHRNRRPRSRYGWGRFCRWGRSAPDGNGPVRSAGSGADSGARTRELAEARRGYGFSGRGVQAASAPGSARSSNSQQDRRAHQARRPDDVGRQLKLGIRIQQEVHRRPELLVRGVQDERRGQLRKRP